MNNKKPKYLKIGIVTDQLLAGGVQLAAIEQVKELNLQGHNAKLLILMRKKYPTDFSYLVKDIPYRYLSDSYPRIFRKTVKFPIFSFLSTLHLMSPILAPKVIKKNEYDILISLGTTTCLTTQAVFRTLNIPYVAVIHDPIVYILKKAYSRTFLKYFFPILKPLARHFEGTFVKDAKETIIISRVHYDYLKKHYGVNAIILPFGSTTTHTIPKKRGKYLLSFGRWQSEKNPEFLLKLIKVTARSKLLIAGNWTDDGQLHRFQELIKKESLQKRVRVIWRYNEKTLSELCRKSRLFVYPHFEAFGLSALEAASHGLPVVIPRNSGVTEMFTHGIHGFFPKNIELREYKKYVNRLLLNERLAYRMGKAAYNRIKGEYSWKTHVDSLLSIVYPIFEKAKTRIIVVETGHALGTPLAGGDSLMEPMATRLRHEFEFSIIASSVGANHWARTVFTKKLTVLPHNLFDNSGKPIQLFLAYCIRMWQTIRIVKKQTLNSFKPTIIYSSTNILPDILPVFFIKKNNREIIWIARIHHLIPPPQKREGKLIVNIVSYFMQAISIFMIKSRADIIIVLNKKLEKELIEMGFPSQKLKVLGGGIDFKKISNITPDNKNSFDAVFLGRFHIAKGIFDTIPIWKEVTQQLPNAKLAIIGDGPDEIKKELIGKIKEANLTENIVILGYIPYPKLYAKMKQAKLFLFLDHEAGWGLAVAEAMACQLPVVGYRNGVLGNVYKNGFRAVPVGNYIQCAKEIINLLELSSIRRVLARQAIKEAAKYDWSHSSYLFQKILNSAGETN